MKCTTLCNIHPSFKVFQTPNGLQLVTHWSWLSSLCLPFPGRPGYMCRRSSQSWWWAAGFPRQRRRRCRWGSTFVHWLESAPAGSRAASTVPESILQKLKCLRGPGQLLSAMCRGLRGKSSGESTTRMRLRCVMTHFVRKDALWINCSFIQCM